MTHTPDLNVYDTDEDDEGCVRLYVNTNAPYATAQARYAARLVDAAPALLVALEAILRDRATQDYGQPTDATLDLARAAIEAAK